MAHQFQPSGLIAVARHEIGTCGLPPIELHLVPSGIAEIRPLAPLYKVKRPIGLAKGEFTVSPEFFEPLPDDVVAAFTGEKQ